jgi:hypothetical protein
MPREYFHLVPRIVEEEKYFDVSRAEIQRELETRGEFGIETFHELNDDGEQVTVTLDLRISYKNGYGGWSVALLLHNERVDGIDFEARYTSMDDQSCSGWHRHCWNEAAKEAKTQKKPLTDLDGIDNLEDFLIRIFATLRIRLNQEDHGNYELFRT